MQSYVDIKTFFDSFDNRTVDNLRQFYNNPKLVYESIKQVVLPHLTPDQIRGKRILLKPNFVREPQKEDDDICLITHPKFILSTLVVLLECYPHSIIIGDAPIQNCRWELMLPSYFYNEVESLSKQYNVPIRVIDFRKRIFYADKNVFSGTSRKDDEYLIFDVGNQSWLESVTSEKNTFRVTNYDPDRMAISHSKGMHKYCIAKEVFESDIIITMPKPKTHRMACLTNSLKILVGINGDKDYLPHHRLGSLKQGGDCYKDYNLFRTWSEKIRDEANRRRGSLSFKPLRIVSGLLWKWGKPSNEVTANAGWYGNDTVWRMVMDINTIAQYGTVTGELADTPQRTIYTLCDGIIGGQGSGPLKPDPLALGLIAFSNDSYLMDECMGYLFGLNIQKVPLLKAAYEINKEKHVELIIDGKKADRAELYKLSTSVKLAPGWVNYDNY